VSSLLLLLLSSGVWLALDSLHARASELIDDAGAGLFAVVAQGKLEAAHTVLLNGLRLRLLTGTSDDPPERVSAVLAERCRSRSGELAVQLQEHAHGKLSPTIARALDPVLQLDDPNGGFVGCLDLGAGRVAPEELLARIGRFARNADVAEIGALRFAWVRREGRRTRFVALWSDERVPLRDAFPPVGDAPGSDVPRFPRPNATRRVLSAWQEGAAPMLVAYESSLPPERALHDYEVVLQASGARVEHAAAALEHDRDATRWLLASRADRSAAVIVAPRAHGSLLIVTPLP
jgi:hypothetical protein